ncbi:MAG: hypothetical protein A2W31_13940, partial [Planctomycetes bacterium RBG_16_64_10]
LAATAMPATHGQVDFAPGPTEAEVPALFRLTPHRFDFRLTPRQRTGAVVRCWTVTFPSPVQTPHPNNNRVHCEYFPPQMAGRRPGVVMLHVLGGEFELARVCCQALAISGTGALFVKLPYYGPRQQPGVPQRMVSADPDQTVAGMRQAVLDIRRAGAWLATRPEIDPQQLGVAGISLGGIVGALAAAAEPRFTKACLVLAGGDVGRVAWPSQLPPEVQQYWQDRGLTWDQVVQRLRAIDPITYATSLRGRRVLMINAAHDEVVPRACAEALWEALGRPEIVWWNSGHITALTHLPEGLARMCAFFQDPSGIPSPSASG